MIARAPGKLVLSGAYSVLEGAPAIVAAVDRFATADSSRAADRVTAEVAEAIRAGAIVRAPWFDASELRTKTPDGGDRKLGLGSSAAILVASIAAAKAPEIADESALRSAVFDPALAAHRAAQGGGSGVDVAASTFGGVLTASLDAHGALAIGTFAIPSKTVITVFASGLSASTPSLLDAVRSFASDHPRDYARALAVLVAGARAAVAATDARGFVAALDAQFVGLRALGVAIGADIVPDELEAFAQRARTNGAAFGPSGAGGGDVSILVTEGAPTPEIIAAIEKSGLERLNLRVGARGVHALP